VWKKDRENEQGQGDEEMEDFSVELTCTGCGRSYHTAMRKMRLNVRNVCPTCGFRNSVSQDDAIRAQRLLERLELEERRNVA
jgi:DNA-directed RNA polymerase subunit RPC12/RpoP